MARYQMGPDVQKFLMVSDAGDNMVAEIVVKLFIIVQWTMSIFCLSRTMTFQQFLISCSCHVWQQPRPLYHKDLRSWTKIFYATII